MIVREIKSKPDEIIANFDFFNDYDDTIRWCEWNCSQEVQDKLRRAYQEWLWKKNEESVPKEAEVKEQIDWEKKAVELARLLLECRDALPAITVTRAKLHGVDLTLADRIEDALEIWEDPDGD